MGFTPFNTTPAAPNVLPQQAATPGAGFPLAGVTANIITWTAPGTPGDGNQHQFILNAQQRVTSAETGGAVTLTYTDPGGTAVPAITVFGAGQAAGAFRALTSGMVESGTTVTLAQSTALTVGAATVWATILGS